MKSIIQSEKDKCFICGRNGYADPLDEHHIFAGINRKNSEKYGLKVYLCHNRCHIFGKDSVHKNVVVAHKLKKYAQQKAIEYYGWSIDDFLMIFGRIYL